MGPMALLLIQTTIQRGRAHGIAGGIAMGLVDGGYALIATTAGLWLSRLLSGWTNWIELFGGLLLIALAFDIWWRAKQRVASGAIHEPEQTAQAAGGEVLSTGAKFAGATILNPPTALYFLAIAPVVGSYAASTSSLWSAAVGFALGVWLASSSWQQAVVAGSHWLAHRINPVWQYRIGVFGALLILGFGAAAIWLGFN
jgi:threonine/homoserine/homoserine lactone efflux protein